jgi:outer membrane protein assembly factor BamA
MVVLAALGNPGVGRAEEPRPPPDPSKGESFDGRVHPAELRDDLLVVPRLLLTPPRLLLNAVFHPVGALVRWMQRRFILEKMVDAVTSRDGLIGVRPAFNFVSGYRATFGLSFFDYKILGEGTALDASVSVDFRDIVIASAALRPTHIARAVEYVAQGGYLRRDDYYYAGIGMEAAQTHTGARYRIQQVDQTNRLHFVLSRHWFASAMGGFVVQRFGNGVAESNIFTSTNDQPIDEVYCVRFFDGRCVPGGGIDPVAVPGFANGTQFVRAGLGLRVDTRDSFYRPTSGAAAAIELDYTHGLGATDPSSYFRLHAGFEAVLDLWRRSHVLLLRASTDLLIPAGSEFVPFTEFPILSTPDKFRGARWGKYRDYSNVLFTAEYRWPVWMWLDAALFVDYGGAFGKAYAGFDISRMIPAVGFGVRLRTSSKFFMALQVAYGFGEGWNLSLSANMDLL